VGDPRSTSVGRKEEEALPIRRVCRRAAAHHRVLAATVAARLQPHHTQAPKIAINGTPSVEILLALSREVVEVVLAHPRGAEKMTMPFRNARDRLRRHPSGSTLQRKWQVVGLPRTAENADSLPRPLEGAAVVVVAELLLPSMVAAAVMRLQLAAAVSSMAERQEAGHRSSSAENCFLPVHGHCQVEAWPVNSLQFIAIKAA